jgi:putative holliday junction resolvase
LRLIGLDVGESRIGVALSDPLGATAQPLQTISRDEESPQRIARLVVEEGAATVVVGLPLLMDGTEGEQARLVRRFVEDLRKAIAVPVELIDERLTTREAEAVLSKGRVKRARKREASDMLAASLILRAYMDSLPEE